MQINLKKNRIKRKGPPIRLGITMVYTLRMTFLLRMHL